VTKSKSHFRRGEPTTSGGADAGNSAATATCESISDGAVGSDCERSPAEDVAANCTSSISAAVRSRINDDELTTSAAVSGGVDVVDAIESDLLSVDATNKWLKYFMTSGKNCGDRDDDDDNNEDWWMQYSTPEVTSAAVFDDSLLAAGRRMRGTTVDVVAAAEGCRVPSAGRRLRRKAKWRVEKARRQLKTRHCRTVTNAAHGVLLYVNHRVSKRMVLVLSEPSTRYRKETSVRQIDREKGRPMPTNGGNGIDETKTNSCSSSSSSSSPGPGNWSDNKIVSKGAKNSCSSANTREGWGNRGAFCTVVRSPFWQCRQVSPIYTDIKVRMSIVN
jgi:hypothetical protein